MIQPIVFATVCSCECNSNEIPSRANLNRSNCKFRQMCEWMSGTLCKVPGER